MKKLIFNPIMQEWLACMEADGPHHQATTLYGNDTGAGLALGRVYGFTQYADMFVKGAQLQVSITPPKPTYEPEN